MKRCDSCKKNITKLYPTTWIIGRFEVVKVRVCKKCLKAIDESDAQFRN